MALIKCPSCGKDVSDKANQCIHCGVILIDDVESKRICIDCGKEIPIGMGMCPNCGYPIDVDEKFDLLLEEKKKSKVFLKLGLVFGILVLAAAAFFTAFHFIGPRLTDEEQLAYENAMKLKDMMKDPDSFKLYDEMFLLNHLDEDGNIEFTYTIFKYGGTNGYGAVTTDEAIFKDGEYIMDYADEPDADASNYIDQLIAKEYLAIYVITNGTEESLEMVDIDIERIKDKMGLD